MTGRDQRGSLAIEFVLLVPVLMLLFGVVVGGARVWLARGAVEQAAAAGARAASSERSLAEAERAGRDLAMAQADTNGLRCARFSVQVDASTLAQDAGTAGHVRASVSCLVPLADVLVPGWPGTIDVSAEATAVVDRYRGRK
jgi:Flp pilus assembly protein TadG